MTINVVVDGDDEHFINCMAGLYGETPEEVTKSLIHESLPPKKKWRK